MSAFQPVNSFEETMAALKITNPATLRGLYRSGKIAYLKTGREFTFTAEAIEAYIAEHQTPAAGANPHGLTATSLRRVRQMKASA